MIYNPNIQSGFFAVMNDILRMLCSKIFYKQKEEIIINWDDPLFAYGDSDINTFEKYFTIDINYAFDTNKYQKYIKNQVFYILFNSDIIDYYKIENIHDNCKKIKYIQHDIKLKENNDILGTIKKDHLIFLNELFNSSLKINKNIIEKVESFYENNMKNYYCIGIHMRSNNCKIIERYKKELECDEVIKNLNDYIKNNNIEKYKIYIATDTKENLNYFINYYQDKLLYNKDNIYMSNTKIDKEPHFGFELNDKNLNNDIFLKLYNDSKPGLKGGIELLTDALILSKCNSFRSTESNLSDWVYIFNPNIYDV
jgi:hypothetical protein